VAKKIRLFKAIFQIRQTSPVACCKQKRSRFFQAYLVAEQDKQLSSVSPNFVKSAMLDRTKQKQVRVTAYGAVLVHISQHKPLPPAWIVVLANSRPGSDRPI